MTASRNSDDSRTSEETQMLTDALSHVENYDEDDCEEDDGSLIELIPDSLDPKREKDGGKIDQVPGTKSENNENLEHDSDDVEENKTKRSRVQHISLPAFPPDKVLRISDYDKFLPKHHSQTWNSVRREKARRKQLYGSQSQWCKNLPPQGEIVETDEAEKFSSLTKVNSKSPEVIEEKTSAVAPWRYGPAKYWYDTLNVPENCENFDYGFKLKEKCEEHDTDKEFKDQYPDVAYLMVTQEEWEAKLIWNADAISEEVRGKLNNENSLEHWFATQKTEPPEVAVRKILSASKRVLPQQQYSVIVPGRNMMRREMISQSGNKVFFPKQPDNRVIEPLANTDLVNYRWEDDVIWDPEQMDHIPEPKILTLDANDENIILDIPPEPKENQSSNDKKDSRKCRILPTDEDDPSEENTPGTVNKDPFNISNDEYYNPMLSQNCALKPAEGMLLQHAIPAIDLHPLYYPTNPGITSLRNYHRPMLKPYHQGLLSHPGPHGVHCLAQHIKVVQKERKKLQEENGGQMFFMKTPHDLSAQDGEIVLAEYSEEYPPLMMQTGMAFKIKNYYKRKAEKSSEVPEYEYGEIAYVHTSPFLGSLAPGQSLQALESNIFRAPLFLHQMPETDFLIIRTHNGYFIRDVNAIFAVGQELPLVEVPQPKCNSAASILKRFLQVYIYHLFQRSTDNPKRCKLDDIKKAFPGYSESSIRKCLNHCAEFKRTGSDASWWVLRPDFRLPTEEEIRTLITPEQYCAYYSMLSAHQRLKDAGYGEKIFLPDDENETDMQDKIDDDIKAAPWNTTKAFIAAMNGKCILEVNGVADPTGCGEGFSYIKVPNKSLFPKEEIDCHMGKRTVVGTDADLRKISNAQGKRLLRQLGQNEEKVKKMNRWDVINLLRILSTQDVKAGNEELRKFARGIRSQTESIKMYKSSCQRVFDIQNGILSSNEVLSTDEGSSSDDEDDSDIEEMGRNIENILSNKKSLKQVSYEREEIQRQELKKFINKNSTDVDKKKDKSESEKDELAASSKENYEGKVLVITRKFKTPEGKEYIRTETVRKAAVISRYVQIQSSSDPNIIKKYYPEIDAKRKEEFRKEKKRIQDQLRRLYRNEERSKLEVSPKKPRKEVLAGNMKCGACGASGHIRTNRVCPHYHLLKIPMHVTMSEEIEGTLHGLDDIGLVKSDDTKIYLSKRFVERVNDVSKRHVKLKFCRESAGQTQPLPIRRNEDKENKQYYSKGSIYRTSSISRISRNPQIALTSALKEIWKKLKSVSEFSWFWKPVDARIAPKYFDIVKRPMDLSQIREKLDKSVYKSRQQFLEDILQIYENSKLYNGENDIITRSGSNLVKACVEELQAQDSYLMHLEMSILNHNKNEVYKEYSSALQTIVEKYMKNVPESWPFFQSDNRGFMKDYQNVDCPMNCKLILEKIGSYKYKIRTEFLDDVELIVKNSISCRGPNSPLTKKAQEILEACQKGLKVLGPKLDRLEDAIAALPPENTNDTNAESLTAENLNDILSEQEYKAETEDIRHCNETLANDLLISDDDDDKEEEEDSTQHDSTSVSMKNGGDLNLSSETDSDKDIVPDSDKNESLNNSQYDFNGYGLTMLEYDKTNENHSHSCNLDSRSPSPIFLKCSSNGNYKKDLETNGNYNMDFELTGSNDSFIDKKLSIDNFSYSSQNHDGEARNADHSMSFVEEEMEFIDVETCDSNDQQQLGYNL